LSKRPLYLTFGAVVVAALLVLAIVLSRARLRRHARFPTAPAAKPIAVPVGVPPVEQWTERFSQLESTGQWKQLDALLDALETKAPDLYAHNSLGYLHARVLIETSEDTEAEAKLEPFLQNGNPLRDLALFHRAEIAGEAAASASRQALIFGYPASIHRDEAIDDETQHLAAGSDPKALADFSARLYPTADTPRRRDLDAHLAEMLLRVGQTDAGLAKAIAVLRSGTMDDPSDRAARAIDKRELIRRLAPEQLEMLGNTMQNHRHFDRAAALLSAALLRLPQKRDGLIFDIGRSYFGDEKYELAQQAYMRGANGTRDPKAKATLLWHAARAAQLRGDDAGAERLMTTVIALPVRTPATLAALTQRIRTRLEQHRMAEAASDLVLLRKIAPKDHALVEGSLAYALSMIAAGQNAAAIATLNTVPRTLLNKYDVAEFDYWRGRAQESSNPKAAIASYLAVLRSPVPSHFAYFARDRLAPRVAGELAARDAQITQLVAAKNFVQAKQVATERVLLTPGDRTKALQTLASIYRELPAYRAVLELTPEPFPRFPIEQRGAGVSPARGPGSSSGRDARSPLLMAMGLFDEASDAIPRRWALSPMRSALTQSLALNRGSASRPSIYAIEVMMNSVPDDFVPEVLPSVIRELLYPRYYADYIEADAKKYEADPTLVLSIMREESRFNPRAKSEAAARGLLQFIITTARDIGRDVGLVDVAPDDLYDPRIVIRLGAKYIATLTKDFGGDRYKAVAAYNAGPHQVALWSRLAPAAGDDYFVSAINFDETKDYVRKVMNSYRSYGSIY
jgi:soluble lytic murein transglycosylase-like protein